MNTVVGLFDHYNNVDWAIEVLENYGVESDRVSVVALDKDAIELGTAASFGALTGAATGSLVGLLAGLSAFVVPGIGPVIVTGTFASTLFVALGTTAIGAGFGAATGGLLGALIDLGFSEEDALFYTEGVKQGGILVSVETGSQDENRIRAILRGAGGMERNSRHLIWKEDNLSLFDKTKKFHEEAYQP